jgi:hypothetical protein
MNLSRYHADVRAYYCNLTANGGSISSSTLAALSIFTNRLKAHGTLWDKLDEIYPLCGRGIASACVKLKFVATPFMTNHNFVDEDFEDWGPTAGLTPDGASKYLDTNFPATSLRDDAHLCYIEQQPAIDSGARAALGVTDAPLEWSIGAVDAFNDRTAIIGDPAAAAQIVGGYNDWTSFYIANRESPTSLTLFKRTHLKDTDTNTAATSPKPALNLFLCARNNSGVADQFWKNRLRYASIGQALIAAEVTDYYQIVQSFQDSLGRSV